MFFFSQPYLVGSAVRRHASRSRAENDVALGLRRTGETAIPSPRADAAFPPTPHGPKSHTALPRLLPQPPPPTSQKKNHSQRERERERTRARERQRQPQGRPAAIPERRLSSPQTQGCFPRRCSLARRRRSGGAGRPVACARPSFGVRKRLRMGGQRL